MASDKITQKDIIDKSVNKEFDDLNKTLTQSVKLVSDLTKAAIDMFKAFNPADIQGVANTQKEYNDLVTKSQSENKKATDTLEKLRQKIKDVNEEEERAKIALQEKRKAVRDKIKAEKDSQKQTEKLTKVLQQNAKTEKEATEQNKKLIAMRKELDVTTTKGAKSVSAINKVIDRNNNLLKNNASTLGKQKMNIGNYSSALQGLGSGFGGAIGMVQRFGVALKALAANPVILILSGIALALKGLVSLFKSTDDGATKLEATMNGLKAVLTVLKGALLDLIQNQIARFKIFIKSFELLKAKIKGNDEEIAKITAEMKELQAQIDSNNPFENIGDRAKEAYNAVHDLTFQMDALNDRIIGSISSQKELELRMKEYVKLSKDQTKTDEERARNLEKAIDTAKELFGNERDFAKETFENEVAIEAAKREINAQTLKELILMDGKQAENARKTNQEIADAWNEMGDDRMKELEEFYVSALDADIMYTKRTTEMISLLSGLRKKIAIQEAKDQEAVAAAYQMRNEKIQEIEAERIEIEVESLSERLDVLAEVEIEKLIEKQEKQQEILDQEVQAQQAADEAKKQSTQDYINFATSQAQQLSTSIIGFASQELANQQMADIEKAKSRGASEEEISKIEKKYAEKRKQLAITQAIINTALAVTNALNTQPFMPLGLIMAVLAAAAGAIEIATISSASFAKGTKDSGNEWLDATVGEIGTERINFADGTSMYTPPTATKMLLPPHSEVVPNIELQRELADLQQANRQKELRAEQKQDFQELIKVVKNKKEVTLNITENGIGVTAKKGNNFYKYIDRKYRG